MRHGPSLPALEALDAVHDRIESPADKLLRTIEPWSSFFVLPIFALANAGVVLSLDAFASHERLMLAIILGLVVGKPLGIMVAAALAVFTGIAVKPEAYSWRQLFGASVIAGIGFTMSLFIASQAFPDPTDFAAAKIAIFIASIIAGAAGIAILWRHHEGAVGRASRRAPLARGADIAGRPTVQRIDAECYSAEMIDRRLFTGLLTAAMLPASGSAFSQPVATRPIKRVRTGTLEIAYEESGPETGFPVLLMHGFPYDPRCYDEVVPALVSRGHRAIVPYLRGYGPRDSCRPRRCAPDSRAAMGQDLLDLMDALRLPRATLVGFDWGGRAACVVAALVAGARSRSGRRQRLFHPEHRRVQGAGAAGAGKSASGISTISTPSAAVPVCRRTAATCASCCGGCGRRIGSSTTPPTNARRSRSTIRISSTSSSTPTVTVSATRQAIPRSKRIERRLAAQPPISAPTIVLQGEGDGVNVPAASDTQPRFFTGAYQRRSIPVIGHNVPQEAPCGRRRGGSRAPLTGRARVL